MNENNSLSIQDSYSNSMFLHAQLDDTDDPKESARNIEFSIAELDKLLNEIDK